jgi:DNA-binding GntR family transcriptional regulator
MDRENYATPPSRAATQASYVHDRLRDDILSGHLEPGARLRLKELMETYDIGNSPLREALNRLSANGLVRREENRGFSVPTVSEAELEELIRTRCWLEEIALRESIANGDSDWEKQLVLNFHWLNKVSLNGQEHEDPTSSEWEQRHVAFHSALIAGCNSNILVEICAQLQTRTLRYRNLAEVVEYRGGHELEEHRKLHEAVLQRDVEAALGILHEHFGVTLKILMGSGRFD